MTLTDFVLARIAEREALARVAAGGFPDWVDGNEETLDGENVYFTVTATRGPGKAGAEWEPDYFLSVHEDRRDSARAAHIALNDPAAVLADCEAKRQIIAEHRPTATQRTSEGHECRTCLSPAYRYDWPNLWTAQPWPCTTLRLLASLDADHPDYDEDWKP